MDDRIGVVGFSAGSYYGALMAKVDPNTRAVVGYYGVYDLEDPGLYFSELTRAHWGTSPARNAAAQGSAAILLLHGDRDNEISITQAYTYRDRLMAAGKTVELVSYPGAHHRFDRGQNDVMRGDTQANGIIYRLDPPSRDDAFNRTVAWLKKYMN